MTYELEFDPRALKEWQKLGETVKKQFRKKLVDVLSNPRVESARLRELPDCYKIKLKTSGYRLVYQVQDDVVLVVVIAIGKREKSAVYR
ncbi:type II toxin-antitoxin system RelE/ParE family toxin [Salmonella enterica]